MVDEVVVALRRIRAGSRAHKSESSTLDFKAPSRKPRETLANLTDAAVCFANAAGGTIVLGVSDAEPGPGAFVGADMPPEAVRHGIFERTSPSLDVVAVPERFDGVDLVRVQVPEGLEVYGTKAGRYTWRRATECVPMTADDVGRLREERRGDDWSARSAGVGADGGAAPLALTRIRDLLADLPGEAAASLRRAPDRELLSSLGLATSRGSLTNAGTVLVGDASDGQASIIYQHRRAASGEPDFVLRLEAPLVVAIQRLNEAMELRLTSTPLNLASGQQVQIPDFPPPAVREAVMNAIAHGDHRTGRPIQIEHSPDWLAVTSPGPLVSGVTPTNILRHPHRARFRALFNALHHLNLVEQVGLGIDRMYREMLRVGRNPPRISEQRDQVTVTFASEAPNLRVARFVSQLDQDSRDDLDVLLVLALLRKRRSVSAPAVADEIQRKYSVIP